MSRKEVERLEVIQQVAGKRLRQKAAARRLGLGVRQIKRLVHCYRAEGAGGLICRHRGRQPNNALPKTVRQEVMALVVPALWRLRPHPGLREVGRAP